MKNSNELGKAYYKKELNITASGILLLWIVIFGFGIFSIINTLLLVNSFFIWSLSYVNPLLYIVFIIGIIPSRRISISILDLIRNKRWTEPSKFIKSTLILLAAATIATILTIFFYDAYNYAEFFSIFTSFAFLFSITFFAFYLRYFRFDLLKDQPYRNPNL